MGKSLYWRISPTKQIKDHCIARTGLKYIMIKKFDSLEQGESVLVDKSLLPYLQGILDSAHDETRQEASQLMQAIEKHGEVEIFLKG